MAKGRLPSVVARGRRIARRRFRRDFGERLLRGFGFGGGDFRSGGFVKGKLGLFGDGLTKTIPGQAGPGAMPPVTQPEKVSNENNPSIATIIDQLDKLVKTANKIGVITKEQQEALIGQIAQAKRISKEQILENKASAAIPEPMEGGSGETIAPLGSAIDELTDKINALTGVVRDKVDDNDSNTRGFMERMADAYGFGDEYRSRRRRRGARAERLANITQSGRPSSFTVGGVEYKQNKAGRWYGPGGRFAKSNIASILDRRQAAATASAARVTGGSLTSRLGNMISAGARGAANISRGGIKSAVRRVAAPLIAKSLGGTALKSIPILGAVAGAGFALDRLIKGDPVGAGLDLMSGLAGPFTAIPALIASIARDVYSSIFGVQPENDPEFATRITSVKNAVEDMVKEELGQKTRPKQTPTQDQVDNAIIPPPTPAPTRTSGPTLPSSPPSPSPSPSPAGGGGGGGGGSPSADTSGAPAGAPAASSAAASPQAERTDAPEVPAEPVPPQPTQGIELNQAAAPQPVTVIPDAYGFNQEMGRFLPQNVPTSRNGHVGAGNVPNPDYIPEGQNNLPDLYRIMFFNVNYQEQ